MSGQPKNMERATQGGTITLDVKFRQYSGGPLADHDNYVASGTLPAVTIVNPSGTTVTDSSESGAVQPVRSSVGEYTYTWPVPADATVSDRWKIVWEITINGTTLDAEEYFNILASGTASFDEEYRIGRAFNNPDLTSSHHFPDWGLLFTPDEIRHMILWGYQLVSPQDNFTYDDNQLQWYIDTGIALVERDLAWDIIPRLCHHQGLKDSNGVRVDRSTLASGATNALPAADIAVMNKMTDEQKYHYVIEEQGYPFRRAPAYENYMHMFLRHRPLPEPPSKFSMVDPVQQTILNLLPFMEENLLEGRVQVSLTQISANLPLFLSGITPIRYPFPNYPAAMILDYRSGYSHSSAVPFDLVDVVRLKIALMLLLDYGRGKSAGLASASINLNSVSESYSTTESAENSIFSGHILEIKKRLDEYYKRHRANFGNSLIGVLG